MINRKRSRCAIYTRKSTDEGLDQDFNSLDAQREACEAFIASQRELGWCALPDHFDDGGLSGGNMDRPALQRLLSDIAAGRIDVVVVYKIDRLTRSLTDFARIVEIFDGQQVSFVSVTQQFNTTTSMGKLTLNVLLSFAQFEREVTAERIRDKIAASKKKGMWMGGLPPLGYDVTERKLVINKSEAETVRQLFTMYLEFGSVRRLQEEADGIGVISKLRIYKDGRRAGGRPLTRGHLYQLLANPIYIGKIRHRDTLHLGQHQAIIDEPTFNAVQALLQKKAPARRSPTNTSGAHLLTGNLFDETGDRLSPTHATRSGRRYRYYISHRLMQARRNGNDGWRLPAGQIEAAVRGQVTRILRDRTQILDWAGHLEVGAIAAKEMLGRAMEASKELAEGSTEQKRAIIRNVLSRVVVAPDRILYEVDRTRLINWLLGNDAAPNDPERDIVSIAVASRLRRRGIEARLVVADESTSRSDPDPTLVRLIARAHSLMKRLASGDHGSISELAADAQCDPNEISRILPLAFLAPDITRAILAGQHPPELTAHSLKRVGTLPMAWPDQRQLLGFSSNA